jgi:hypothetical protein
MLALLGLETILALLQRPGDRLPGRGPRIGALDFVLRRALGGGVTCSLALDAHGKGLSPALRSLEIPGPDRGC